MGRLYIDVTDLETYDGIRGGIERVVYGIARGYYERSSDGEVCFITYSAANNCFFETDFAVIVQRVEGRRSERTPELTEDSKGHDFPTPQGLREKISPYVPARIRKNTMVRKLAGVNHQPVQPADTPAAVSFAPKDTVLVMGKPWDNLKIQETFIEAKTTTGCKLVFLIHDLIICLYPHLHNPVLVKPFKDFMVSVITHADLILAISESTKKDIDVFAKAQGLVPPRCTVVREGDDGVRGRVGKATKPDDRIARPFIACVGTIEIRKNHMLLYYAYKLAAERKISLPDLVIVGSGGWLADEVIHLFRSDPAVNSRVHLLHGLDDDGLAWVYENCIFTVYPSMYEGWGLPIAESLAYGKLCIASHASSMREIAGDVIDYFSPYSPEQLLEKLVYYSSASNRDEKEKAIRDGYRLTSWVETYEQVDKALKELR